MPHNLVKLVDRLKADSEEFWLSPKQWKKSKVPTSLKWSSARFDKADVLAIPKVRGIYAFAIEVCSHGFPPHGYVMYVGETGHDSKETLRSRFLSYFAEMTEQSRPVHYALLKYRKYLSFCYTRIPDKRRNLRKLETVLCDALIPPYNVQDFSLEMRRGKKAL